MSVLEPAATGPTERNNRRARTEPQAEETAAHGWFDLVQMSWRIALMPTMAWTSYFTAAWKAWENPLQPQWPTQ